MEWAKTLESRDQLVLFPTRLDESIVSNHRVRLLDEILSRLDWSQWESEYNLRRGQPPIHPQVLAGVILYGLLVRIRSSRGLEEALQIRLDFRWLVSGRSIDHTTLSEFRRKNGEALKNTFVQIGMIAREMGCLPLQTLAFDGTRMRSNNRRSGTRTPESLREMKQELAKKYSELEAKTNACDLEEEERLGNESAHQLSEEFSDVQIRLRRVDAALAELDQLERAGETLPKRLPITDPSSRVMPNKDGGFSPNFTPTATVDVDSGLIVSADVLSRINEDKSLISSIKDVEEQFGLETPPPTVLADSLMSTSDNLSACKEHGVELFSPVKGQRADTNPALRDDPSQPVTESERDQLPTTTVSRQGEKCTQLDKQAFVYDKEKNCYWCPQGKPLSHSTTTTEKKADGGQRIRHRYHASAEDCSACPLKAKCIHGRTKFRSIGREQHESLREAHATKMATEAAKKTYARRSHAGERPFAMIKQMYGARQFLLRGLDQVKKEWHWLVTAFNLDRLMSLLGSRAGPFSTS